MAAAVARPGAAGVSASAAGTRLDTGAAARCAHGLDDSPIVPTTTAVMDEQGPLKTGSAPVGRRGGAGSHRTPPGAEARDRARVREARRAFRDYHAQCFWYLRPDMQVTLGDVPEILRGLRRHGGRKGFLLAARLCR